MYGELTLRPVPATKTRQAPSRQYRATPSVLNIISSRLPGVFVQRRRPFAYKRGVGDASTVSGFSCGVWSYLWLTLKQKGHGIAFCTLHKYKTSITTELRYHVKDRQGRTAVGSAMRLYRYIYSSVLACARACFVLLNSTECETRFLFH